MAKDDEISDDNTLNLVVYPDEPPSSGVWVDVDEVIAHPTAQEVADGQMQGGVVDDGDDDDE